MDNNCNVQETLKTLQEVMNNPNLIIGLVGGRNFYLMEPRVSKISGKVVNSRLMVLGHTSNQINNKLIDLLNAHWLFANYAR